MKAATIISCLLAFSSIPCTSSSIARNADDDLPEEVLFSFIQILDYALARVENLRTTISQTVRDSPGIYRLTVDALTRAPELNETKKMLESTNDVNCLNVFDSNLELVVRKSFQIVKQKLNTEFKKLDLPISKTYIDLNYTKTILKEHLNDRIKEPTVCTGDGKCVSLLHFVTRVNSLFNEVVHLEKTELLGIFASTFLWLREKETSQLIREKIVQPVSKCLRRSE